MKTQLALALLLAVSMGSVQAQQSSGSSSSGGSSSGASPNSTTNAGKSQPGPAKDEPPAQKNHKKSRMRDAALLPVETVHRKSPIAHSQRQMLTKVGINYRSCLHKMT